MLKNIHFSVTLLVFGVVGTIESSVFSMALGNGCIPECGFDRLMMVSIGLLSFIAQIMLTVSLQLEEAGKVRIARKAGDILFAFLFQIWSVECARSLPSWGSCHALWGQEDCRWSSLNSLSQDEISLL